MGKNKSIKSACKIRDWIRIYLLSESRAVPTVFLEDGKISTDNNAAEQANRGFYIGKAN